MQAAIRDWAQLYYQAAPTPEEDPCQRLPVLVVSKITKAAFSEYQADSDSEDAKRILLELGRVKGKAVQQALIGGQSFLKPIFGQGGLTFSVIPRGSYLPLGRDERGDITDIGTAERTVEGRNSYTLLERRRVDAAGNLIIESKLYLSGDGQTLGVQVPLDTLEKYAGLVPELVLHGVGSIGLIPVRCPQENTVDGSPDAVSVYAPAAGLIHNVNRNEAQLDREFENGRSRVFASADLLKTGADGRKRLDDDLFVGLDDDPETVGVTVFSPTLREASFLARKTEYLRNVESLIGLKRGILSDVEAAERTATEVTSSAGDYNLTIIDFQRMWERAAREAVRVCEILGRLYKVFSGGAVDPEKNVTISWGNGVLYDEDQVWTEYKAMVSSGMLKPEIALGWYFDLPTETEADLAYIRKRYMPEQDAPVDE
nr:MAG TPA: portal protein [Caudoviricetes sp.]